MEQTEEALDPLANPYAPPRAASSPPARRRGEFSKLVWVYVALQGAAIAAYVAQIAGWTALPLGVLPLLAAAIVGVLWFYRAWERLPERLRVIDGHHLPPSTMVLRHFIPIYGLYWLFRAQHLLCGALDARLKEKGRGGAAPTGIATLACALQLVNTLALPPVVILAFEIACASTWTAYMFAIERCFALAFRKRGAT